MTFGFSMLILDIKLYAYLMRESRNVHVSVVNAIELSNYMSVSVWKDGFTEIGVLLLGLSQEQLPFLLHF